MGTIFTETALLPEGWSRDVRIGIGADGRIESVAPDSRAQTGDTVLAGRTLLPAPTNLHSHAFQRALAGLTEKRGAGGQDSFWTWRQLMYAFVDVLTPEHVAAIAALSQMEMLEAGYACVGEFHYLHHQNDGTGYDNPGELSARIIEAASDTGIGLTLLPVYYAQGSVDGRALEGGQLRFKNNPDSFAEIHSRGCRLLKSLGDDGCIGIAPHSLRAVTPSDLSQLIETYRDGPIHIHIAEQMAEIEAIQEAYGQRPVAWLFDHASVDENWCLVHATHMEEGEISALASSKAVAGLCPVTEANLGDGIFPAVSYLGQGGVIGVGTDSNIAIDLVQEMRLLEYSQRLRDQARSVLGNEGQSTGRYLFEQICQGGAKAAGRKSGQIAPGYWADLMSLDNQALSLVDLSGDTFLDAWIFASRELLVQDVWSAGRYVVRDGYHYNRQEIEKRYRKTMADLRARL